MGEPHRQGKNDLAASFGAATSRTLKQEQKQSLSRTRKKAWERQKQASQLRHPLKNISEHETKKKQKNARLEVSKRPRAAFKTPHRAPRGPSRPCSDRGEGRPAARRDHDTWPHQQATTNAAKMHLPCERSHAHTHTHAHARTHAHQNHTCTHTHTPHTHARARAHHNHARAHTQTHTHMHRCTQAPTHTQTHAHGSQHAVDGRGNHAVSTILVWEPGGIPEACQNSRRRNKTEVGPRGSNRQR